MGGPCHGFAGRMGEVGGGWLFIGARAVGDGVDEAKQRADEDAGESAFAAFLGDFTDEE